MQEQLALVVVVEDPQARVVARLVIVGRPLSQRRRAADVQQLALLSR